MVLPSAMPAMGTSCRALYHGSGWTTPSTTMNAMVMDDASSVAKTGSHRPPTWLRTRLTAIGAAHSVMASSTSATSHQVW